MTNLLLLNNFYPVIYRRVQKENDELLYTIWSLVMVRNRLPAQVVNSVLSNVRRGNNNNNNKKSSILRFLML